MLDRLVIEYKGESYAYVPAKKVNPKNPTGFDETIRYDGIGKLHTNKVTGEKLMPHVHDKKAIGELRLPEPWEIPKT